MALLADANEGNYISAHGALQFRSPELFNPRKFGLENDEPSKAADVYALALVAVEVM